METDNFKFIKEDDQANITRLRPPKISALYSILAHVPNPEYKPVVVYTEVAGLNNKIEENKKGEHSMIVCVNMLGEGFDIPNLKIAAIHDERQSLPVTLQFIGRFTRISYNKLGSMHQNLHWYMLDNLG